MWLGAENQRVEWKTMMPGEGAYGRVFRWRLRFLPDFNVTGTLTFSTVTYNLALQYLSKVAASLCP